jgi:hypothetical protein
MINFEPMGLISTPFISYHEIDVSETDLLDDAWGLNTGYCDVIKLLDEYKQEPGSDLISSLIELARDLE